MFPESAFMSMAYVAFLDTCTNDQFQAMSIVRDVMHMSAAVDLRYMVFAKLQVGGPPPSTRTPRRCSVHPTCSRGRGPCRNGSTTSNTRTCSVAAQEG